MTLLVRLSPGFDRKDIAGHKMDDEADEAAETVQYLSVDDEASWHKVTIPCMLALCYVREENR
jgi:hypothetical protein